MNAMSVSRERGEREKSVLTDRHVHSCFDIRPHMSTLHTPSSAISSLRVCLALCTLDNGEETLQDNYPCLTSQTGCQQPSPWLSSGATAAFTMALVSSHFAHFHFCTTLRNRSRDEPLVLVSKGSISCMNLW